MFGAAGAFCPCVVFGAAGIFWPCGTFEIVGAFWPPCGVPENIGAF